MHKRLYAYGVVQVLREGKKAPAYQFFDKRVFDSPNSFHSKFTTH
jgi:hypothetical protein